MAIATIVANQRFDLISILSTFRVTRSLDSRPAHVCRGRPSQRFPLQVLGFPAF